jgi:hypothetical protein
VFDLIWLLSSVVGTQFRAIFCLVVFEERNMDEEKKPFSFVEILSPGNVRLGGPYDPPTGRPPGAPGAARTSLGTKVNLESFWQSSSAEQVAWLQNRGFYSTGHVLTTSGAQTSSCGSLNGLLAGLTETCAVCSFSHEGLGPVQATALACQANASLDSTTLVAH